jgi:hypothetical protein
MDTKIQTTAVIRNLQKSTGADTSSVHGLEFDQLETGSADSVKGLRVRSSGRCAAVVARLQISPQQAVREARLPINQSVLPA